MYIYCSVLLSEAVRCGRGRDFLFGSRMNAESSIYVSDRASKRVDHKKSFRFVVDRLFI